MNSLQPLFHEMNELLLGVYSRNGKERCSEGQGVLGKVEVSK